MKRVRKDQLDEELVCAQPDEKGAPLERPSHTGGVAASFDFDRLFSKMKRRVSVNCGYFS